MNNNLIAVVLLVIIMLLGSPIVSARPAYLDAFNQQYDMEGTRLDTCATCHINPSGGGSRNPYGMAYAASGRDFASIEELDSDGDGFTNVKEINALTFPGDPADYPQTESEIPSTEDLAAPINEGQEQEMNEEPSGESESEQQSPGFGAVLAIVGILSAIYFKRKG